MNVAQAHAHCATLPGATLDHKWKFEDSVHPVYSVGGRMFAMFSMKSGKLEDRIMFKVDDARFLELTDRPGIDPMPYLARAKWVAVDSLARLSDAELVQLLAEAHAVILAKCSKKMQAAIRDASARPTKPATTAAATAATTAAATRTATKKAVTRKIAVDAAATNTRAAKPARKSPR